MEDKIDTLPRSTVSWLSMVLYLAMSISLARADSGSNLITLLFQSLESGPISNGAVYKEHFPEIRVKRKIFMRRPIKLFSNVLMTTTKMAQTAQPDHLVPLNRTPTL